MKNLVFLLAVIFLFDSCDKNSSITKIDSDIIISVSRVDGNIQLNAETEREYSDSSYELIHCFKVRKNKIYTEFKKIKSGDIGLTVITPARCKIDLGNLSSGTYEVTFCLNKQKTKGKLHVGNEIELELGNGNVKTE